MPPVPKAVAHQAVGWPLNAPVECSSRDHGSDSENRARVAERLISGALWAVRPLAGPPAWIVVSA